MKKQKTRKKIIKLLLSIQLISIIFNFSPVKANINEGEKLVLVKDHKCNLPLEYLDKYKDKWKDNTIWYVYYTDLENGKKQPAFCVEQVIEENIENIVIEFKAEITKPGSDMKTWRILNKGYMGSNYKEWNLECDDDLYVATKIAIQELMEDGDIEGKYRAKKDNNNQEEIEKRVKKVLEVAKKLYNYGINGTEAYEEPKIAIREDNKAIQEKIEDILYYVQNYKLESNGDLISYQVKLENFPKETKILNGENKEQEVFTNSSLKIAVPVNKIQENIIGKIKIENAEVKTNLFFHCLSYGKESQSYRVCSNEKTSTQIELEIEAKPTNLYIKKIDKETKVPISNVTFEIKDEKGNKLQEITTNKEGIAKIENIIEQTVIVKEIKVPKDYIISNEEVNVELKWGEITNVIIENERKKEEKIPDPPKEIKEEPKLPRTGF